MTSHAPTSPARAVDDAQGGMALLPPDVLTVDAMAGYRLSALETLLDAARSEYPSRFKKEESILRGALASTARAEQEK